MRIAGPVLFLFTLASWLPQSAVSQRKRCYLVPSDQWLAYRAWSSGPALGRGGARVQSTMNYFHHPGREYCLEAATDCGTGIKPALSQRMTRSWTSKAANR
ncbi:hypothetical protein CLAIMM_10168 [Cladophialophora immunda]|nr:hypothetical protein CLAIMM_10168 [Cladophialophora immunda]